jgi:phosphatidate cytidylyltransferase
MIMQDGEPAGLLNKAVPASNNLVLRIASAAILAPLAIGIAYLGGWPFTAFWTIAAVAVWWEWVGLVQPEGRNVVLATGICILILEGVLIQIGSGPLVVMMIALGVLAAIVTAGRKGPITGAGILYASALLIAPVITRSETALGFATVLFVFAIVWGTDIGGYFAGRLIGGAKLAPAISPKKTWSGAAGGTLTAVIAGLAIAFWFAGQINVALAALAVALSIASQAGDLFESWLKRNADAKDSGALIPGHGGVMDRLDGFIFAAALAALIGVLRGGFESPASGLLLW